MPSLPPLIEQQSRRPGSQPKSERLSLPNWRVLTIANHEPEHHEEDAYHHEGGPA